MHQQHYTDTDTLYQIQQHITLGVNLDLITQPVDIKYNNTYSVSQHLETVRSRLIEYIAFGAVIQLPDTVQPKIVQPLHVIIKKNKKPRLVIDLSRNLNDHLPSVPFSYSTVESAVKQSYQYCWYAKLDLSNCFLSFPLHPSVLKYFIFQLDQHYYQFIRMPFGLKPAPLVCTQLLSVIAFALQQQSIVIVRYLDDFLIIGQSFNQVQQQLATAINIFQQFGLVVNPEKTEGPVQIITFLGIQLDSINCTLSCTIDRIVELKHIIQSIINPNTGLISQHHSLRCRSILSLLGKFSFAAQVLPGARPFMRRMIDLTRHKAYSTRIRISTAFCLDLQYWYNHLNIWNGRQLWRYSQPFTIVSDASLQGFGFYLESIPSQIQLNLPTELQVGSSFLGHWSECHAEFHATHRGISWCELFSVFAAVHIYAPYLENQSIILVVDNQTDVHIINRQSTSSTRLAILLRALYDVAINHNIRLTAVHRPGEQNILADFLSRPALHCNQPLQCWNQHLTATASTVGIDTNQFPSLSHVSQIYSGQFQIQELNNSLIQTIQNSVPLSIYLPQWPLE